MKKPKLKKYPKGGEIKPYLTEDSNDPRIKQYSDSLMLSSQSALNRYNLMKDGFRKNNEISSDRVIAGDLTGVRYADGVPISYNQIKGYNPVSETLFTKNKNGEDTNVNILNYKPPVQPVKLIKKEPIKSKKVEVPYEPPKLTIDNIPPQEMSKKPTLNSKYRTTDKAGKQYYFANQKPVSEQEYNNYYKNLPEVPEFRNGGYLPKYYNGAQTEPVAPAAYGLTASNDYAAMGAATTGATATI